MYIYIYIYTYIYIYIYQEIFGQGQTKGKVKQNYVTYMLKYIYINIFT
jgi:hypothetical protein